MTEDRVRRRKMIAEIVRAGDAASQEDVTARLARLGLAVTQATVSRDLDRLGAVKVKRNGSLRYALPDQVGDTDYVEKRLERILSEWVRSVEAAGSLLVIKTPPGSAHLVAVAIDGANLPDIAGTISGDDTVFAALRDGVVAHAVADRLRALSSQEPS